jgi:ABC-type transport system involved in multi-copper enzyme maturation permease subunit
LALLLFLLISFCAEPLILLLSKSPNGANDEIAYIRVGINLIFGVIVGCTALIISTIKENSKK